MRSGSCCILPKVWTPQELAQLGEMALARGEPHLAVLIGKEAAEQGVIIPRAYFPVTDLVPDGLPSAVPWPCRLRAVRASSIPTVISSAGARGLMQVMPETARMMATEDRARIREGHG